MNREPNENFHLHFPDFPLDTPHGLCEYVVMECHKITNNKKKTPTKPYNAMKNRCDVICGSF